MLNIKRFEVTNIFRVIKRKEKLLRSKMMSN